MSGNVVIRLSELSDASEIARIYNEGIAEGLATFETRCRQPEEIEAWFDGAHPVVVVEQSHKLFAFASTSSYRSRDCYRGIAEVSVYVARENRGSGHGRSALQHLLLQASAAGYWKLVARVFPENAASRGLLKSLGFREVGVYEKHGRLNGAWKDVIIVERLLPANL